MRNFYTRAKIFVRTRSEKSKILTSKRARSELACDDLWKIRRSTEKLKDTSCRIAKTKTMKLEHVGKLNKWSKWENSVQIPGYNNKWKM